MSLDFELLKACELEILGVFDRYCREHSLQYYLIGGALLGAARYGKFIPWDDDIDVAMPREDYERFFRLWQERPVDAYFLQRAETDPLFARGITKLRKNDTEVVEEISQGVNMHKGVYIDIFPVDYLPKICERKIEKRAKKIRRLLSLRAIRSGYIGKRRRIVKKIIRLGLLPVSLRSLDRRIEKLCTEQNTQEHKYAILWTHNYDWRHQLHKIEVLGEAGTCEFCGQVWSAPADTHAFLVTVFGQEYRKEPPKEKQIFPHHYLSFRC